MGLRNVMFKTQFQCTENRVMDDSYFDKQMTVNGFTNNEIYEMVTVYKYKCLKGTMALRITYKREIKIFQILILFSTKFSTTNASTKISLTMLSAVQEREGT